MNCLGNDLTLRQLTIERAYLNQLTVRDLQQTLKSQTATDIPLPGFFYATPNPLLLNKTHSNQLTVRDPRQRRGMPSCRTGTTARRASPTRAAHRWRGTRYACAGAPPRAPCRRSCASARVAGASDPSRSEGPRDAPAIHFSLIVRPISKQLYDSMMHGEIEPKNLIFFL